MLDLTNLNVPEELLHALFASPDLAPTQRSLKAGEPLFEPGSEADRVFYVQDGQVRLYLRSGDGDERLLEIYGPGQWIGAEALAGRAIHHDRAVAMAPTTVTVMEMGRLMEALGRHPAVAVRLMRQLAEAVQLAREEGGRLVFEDCDQRLVRALVRFSRSAAAKSVEDGVVLEITHQQLAQAVGVARETVSLALTRLRRRDLLQTGRNKLTFNPAALTAFAAKCRPAEPGRPGIDEEIAEAG